MNNIKIAKELIKIAKSLIVGDSFSDGLRQWERQNDPADYDSQDYEGEYETSMQEQLYNLKINGEKYKDESVILKATFTFNVFFYYYRGPGQRKGDFYLSDDPYSIKDVKEISLQENNKKLELNDNDEIEFECGDCIKNSFKGKYKDLKAFLSDEKNIDYKNIIQIYDALDENLILEEAKSSCGIHDYQEEEEPPRRGYYDYDGQWYDQDIHW